MGHSSTQPALGGAQVLPLAVGSTGQNQNQNQTQTVQEACRGKAGSLGTRPSLSPFVGAAKDIQGSSWTPIS